MVQTEASKCDQLMRQQRRLKYIRNQCAALLVHLMLWGGRATLQPHEIDSRLVALLGAQSVLQHLPGNGGSYHLYSILQYTLHPCKDSRGCPTFGPTLLRPGEESW